MIELLSSVQTGARGAGKDLAVKGDAQERNRERLHKACQEFEALFIAYMLKVMRQTAGSDKEANGLSMGANSPYQEIFDWELAKKLSQRSPLGVGSELLRQYSGSAEERPGVPDFGRARELPLGNWERIAKGSGEEYRLNAQKLDKIIRKAASRYNLEPELVQAVIEAESSGDPRAWSIKGAKGLMQLLDDTAREQGVVNVFDPAQNVEGGAGYLRQMLDRFGGDTKIALAAYNAGPGAVERYNGVPPYAETINYVNKVINLYRQNIQEKRESDSSDPLKDQE